MCSRRVVALVARMSPYRIPGPACISFSGGRTSAYMLRQIVNAHGGTLPDDVIVTFANTGKERDETLDFVDRVATEWAVPVVWLEYRETAPGFEVVGHNSASRAGEPYSVLVGKKQYLPNAVTRFCTAELKVRPIKKYLMSSGFDHWTMVLGLRADEPRRIAKATAPNKERWDVAVPLARAGATEQTVTDFWKAQPFDLQLRSHEGNCDLCFLKGRGKLAEIIKRTPERADWWIAQEQRCGATFRKDRLTYAAIREAAVNQVELFDEATLDDCWCNA